MARVPLWAEQDRQRLRTHPRSHKSLERLDGTQAARAAFHRAAELDPSSKLLDRRAL